MLILLAVAISAGGAVAIGALRWSASTKKVRMELEAMRAPFPIGRFDSHGIEGLPPVAQRYFRAVLTEGQPIITSARLSHEGQFNMGEAKPNWRRFRSTQLVITHRPGFDWDARIAMAPGVRVFVRDAYIGGRGLLHAAVLGLVTVADVRDTREAAEGELMRFLAEAAWYPTRLLPSQEVLWKAIDDSSASATIEDGDNAATLELRFAEDGLIHSVSAAARYRAVDGAPVATPWGGRFWAYELRNGMRIPLEGEVAWQLPQGASPYCVVASRVSPMSLQTDRAYREFGV